MSRWTLLVALAMLPATVTAQPVDDARRAVKQMAAAMHCAAWSRLRTVARRGTIVADGGTGTLREFVDVHTGRWMRAWTLGGFAQSEGFDGTHRWAQDLSGASHTLDAPHARAQAATDAWLLRRGWCAAIRDDTAVSPLLAQTTAEAIAVRAIPQHGAPVDLWISRTTHLLLRSRQQLNESHRVDEYSDWRTVGNIVVPFHEHTVYPEDQSTVDVQAITVTLNAPVPSPPAPSAANDSGFIRSARTAVVPYSVEGNKPLVDVSIDGVGPLPFVVDSGGHLIVTAETARRLRLNSALRANSLGAGTGILHAGFARVNEIRIGNAIIRDQVAKILPFPKWRLDRGLKAPIAGWLGLELFERFAVTFDPRSRFMRLTPLGKNVSRRGTRLPLVFEEDAPLTPCTISRIGGLCMVDTGNAGFTIVEGYWARRHAMESCFQRGNDTRDGIWIGRTAISLGGLRLGPELVEYIPPQPRGSEATTVEAGILGEDVVNHFVATFDYGSHAMWLAPIAGRTPRPFSRSGLVVSKNDDGTFVVRSVYDDSPASGAGIQSGDRIVAIDRIPASHVSRGQFADLSVGPLSTRQVYEIARKDGTKRTVTLTLRDISVPMLRCNANR